MQVATDSTRRDRTCVTGGRGRADLVRRHPLGAFFVLACLFSWAYWIPAALFAPHLSHFPGLLGPMLAAVVVTSIRDGTAGLRDLSTRALRWRVPLRWYAVALVPVVAALLALLALAAAGRGWPSLDDLSTMPGVPELGWIGLLTVVLVVNGYGEEVGWRGFAWARLRKPHTLGGAAILLTIPWAIWHLPTFWLDTGLAELDVLVVPGWLVGLAAGAVVLGWLYDRARSSLLLVALFHAFLNMASATRATEGVPAVAVSVIVIVWAIALLRREGSIRSSHAAKDP